MIPENAVSCTHCSGQGYVVKPPKRPATPLTEREWVITRDDLTTCVLVALSVDKVAVARAFTAPSDTYKKAKGQNIARSRMRNLLPIYKNGGKSLWMSQHALNTGGSHVIFEVVPPHELSDEEEQYFNDKIKPRFEGVAVPGPEAEVLVPRPEASGCGPVL